MPTFFRMIEPQFSEIPPNPPIAKGGGQELKIPSRQARSRGADGKHIDLGRTCRLSRSCG